MGRVRMRGGDWESDREIKEKNRGLECTDGVMGCGRREAVGREECGIGEKRTE